MQVNFVVVHCFSSKEGVSNEIYFHCHFNYLDSSKTGAVKSKNNTAKIKKLFLKLKYPVFDTHLMATLKKNIKYEVVLLN